MNQSPAGPASNVAIDTLPFDERVFTLFPQVLDGPADYQAAQVLWRLRGYFTDLITEDYQGMAYDRLYISDTPTPARPDCMALYMHRQGLPRWHLQGFYDEVRRWRVRVPRKYAGDTIVFVPRAQLTAISEAFRREPWPVTTA